MIKLCQVGNTCAGCPAMGLGIELGTQVAQTAQAVHDQVGLSGLQEFGNITQYKRAVVEKSRFSTEVVDDGPPYYTAVGVLRRIAKGECGPYNNQLNEGEV